MRKIVLLIVSILAFCSCDRPYWDNYDSYIKNWYYDCYHYGDCPQHGYSILEHRISTNNEIYYIRTVGCPRIFFDNYRRVYQCFDRERLIIESTRPITIYHDHN